MFLICILGFKQASIDLAELPVCLALRFKRKFCGSSSAMAFWGVEIRPGKPFIHQYEDENGRLHVSQATLGDGSSNKKTVVQCKVGDKSPIYLCSFLPERIETCALNLEFEEDDEVAFSVNGPHSVHLSGFYHGEKEDEDNMMDDYSSDLSEGNSVEIDSEDEGDSLDYFSDDDDLGMFSPSSIPNSGVKIEEIVEDDKTSSEIGISKQGKKKKNKLKKSDTDGNQNPNHQIVSAGTSIPLLESEDEDGFPCQRTKDTDNTTLGKDLKRKIDSVSQDNDLARGTNEPSDSSELQKKNVSKNDVKTKKNKKKKVASEKEESPKAKGGETLPEGEQSNNRDPTIEKRKEKKKNKQNKQGETETGKADKTVTDKKGSILENIEIVEAKSFQMRTFPNGLIIDELVMGKPDGRRAAPGKKVSVYYIGKLKKNGKIFDSNIGRAPFKFRLGIGQVIKGWDVGVNGMRIGDKRKLTIPPAMGYGDKGCGPAIPPNSWLVFEVDLVDVN